MRYPLLHNIQHIESDELHPFEYVTFATENNLIHEMFRPAPKDEWQKLSTSKPMKHITFEYTDKLVSEVDLLMAA